MVDASEGLPFRPEAEQEALPQTVVLHDYLTQHGGAERVALLLAQLVGDGAITTSAFLPERTHPAFRDVAVTELLHHVPRAALRSRSTLGPLAAAAFSRHRVDADVVLSSSSGWAHWTPTRSPSVVYCHTPPRWFWAPEDYFSGLPPRAARVATALSRSTRWVDRRKALAQGSDAPRRYVANSTVVRDRIREAYGVDAQVVFPPTTVDLYGLHEVVPGLQPGFVLTIARDRGYKNIGAAQGIFRTGEFGQLVVVGSPRRGARGHVLELGRVTEPQLRWLYAKCRAVLALSREDFGLTPVEGHARGKPTVALRAGGYLDTCIEGVNAVFTSTLDPVDITQALRELDGTTFDPVAVTATAERFSVSTFRAELGAVLRETADR